MPASPPAGNIDMRGCTPGLAVIPSLENNKDLRNTTNTTTTCQNFLRAGSERLCPNFKHRRRCSNAKALRGRGKSAGALFYFYLFFCHSFPVFFHIFNSARAQVAEPNGNGHLDVTDAESKISCVFECACHATIRCLCVRVLFFGCACYRM